KADPASRLKLLTDTLDFAALSAHEPLQITLDSTGTHVTLTASDTTAVNSVTLSNQEVETFWGGAANDSFTIRATANHFNHFDGGEGSDSYHIDSATVLAGDVLIQDTGKLPAVDQLLFDGKDDSQNPDQVGVTKSQIILDGGRKIDYALGGADSGLEAIVLN